MTNSMSLLLLPYLILKLSADRDEQLITDLNRIQSQVRIQLSDHAVSCADRNRWRLLNAEWSHTTVFLGVAGFVDGPKCRVLSCTWLERYRAEVGQTSPAISPSLSSDILFISRPTAFWRRPLCGAHPCLWALGVSYIFFLDMLNPSS